jgi:uncharacterized membrane protein YebE (DUF533 family)
MFNLGRLAAALLTGGRGGRSAEARLVRAVTQVVTGESAPRSPRRGSAEATRRRKEAEALGLPAPRPRGRSRTTSPERAVATGAAVLAETIAERMTRGSVPTTAPRQAPPAGTAAPRPPAPPRVPAPPPPSEGLLLVRAMVAAAKADGRLDATERKAILDRLEIAGLSVAERDIVLADFDRPATAEELGKGVKDALLAARIYAAAAAAAGERCAAEQAFLAALAKALKLDAPAVAAIEQRLAG